MQLGSTHLVLMSNATRLYSSGVDEQCNLGSTHLVLMSNATRLYSSGGDEQCN